MLYFCKSTQRKVGAVWAGDKGGFMGREGIPESLVSKFSDNKSHLKDTNCYQSPLAYAKL